MSEYTKPLAKYTANLKYEDIDATTVEQIKIITLHTLAASLSALPMPQTKATIDMTMKKGGNPQATVWGSDGSKKVPVDEAAFSNGTLADIMDWEDCSWIGHPSAGAIPVAMAMSEALGKSGKDYITAAVAGFEVYHRIGMAVQPTREFLLSGRGWGLVSWQIYSCCIPAAKLMGFSTEQVMQTLGAAYHQTLMTVNKHSEGTAKSDIYHYVHGFNARNGINAAFWTEAGFYNLYTPLEGKNGLWHQLSDTEDPSWYTKDLGTRFLTNEVLQKHWPANMWIQCPLDAMDYLRKKHDLTPEKIKKIRVSPTLEFLFQDYFKSTRGPLDAQFSIPFCLSAYLYDNTPSAKWFSQENLNSEKIAALSQKFEGFGPVVIPQDNFKIFQTGSFPEVTVEVTLNDDTVVSHTMFYPKGHPRNKFTFEEECDHFRMATAPVMKADQAERLINVVGDLEKLDNLDELAMLTTIK